MISEKRTFVVLLVFGSVTWSSVADTASLLHQLQPERSAHHRAGCESWSCTWSGDGSLLAWSCGNHIVKLIPWNRCRHCMLSYDNTDDDLWQWEGEPEEVTLDAGQLVWALAFGSAVSHTKRDSTSLNWSTGHAPDLLLATGLQSGCIKIWHVRSRTVLLELADHVDVIRDLNFAPDGSLRLVSASRDGTLRVWQLQHCRVNGSVASRTVTVRQLDGVRSKWMYGCCWSPDASLLASVGDNRSVILWDMSQYKAVRHLDGHLHDVCGCDFSPDGALLATSSYDTQVIVWDPHIGTRLLQLCHLFPLPPAHFMAGVNHAYVRSVSFSHDGRHVATVSDDSNLRFWDIYSPEVPCQVASVTNALCCRYSPDGTTLAVGTRNGIATLWRARMQVSSLQHLCRLAIRRLLPTDRIDGLNVPERLKRFLCYAVHW